MHRRLVITIICVGFAGLSCEIPPIVDADVSLQASLATVGDLPTAPDESAWTVPTNEADVRAIEIERILAELKRRHTGLSGRELEHLARTIVEQAEIYDFEPNLLMAVIHVESAGYHLAVSHVGALGLMQILPSTGEEIARKLGLTWHGPDSLFDPIMNVKLGAAYLRELMDRYESMPTALAAYNWGPGRIDRRLRRGASVPSRYIEQVMKAYRPRESGRS
jgi:soluble lytic murein transglycosylase-like protein